MSRRYSYNPFTDKLDAAHEPSTVSLTELLNVLITAAINQQHLEYDSSDELWKNVTDLTMPAGGDIILKAGQKVIFDGN